LEAIFTGDCLADWITSIVLQTVMCGFSKSERQRS